jgi:hypothetical protein
MSKQWHAIVPFSASSVHCAHVAVCPGHGANANRLFYPRDAEKVTNSGGNLGTEGKDARIRINRQGAKDAKQRRRCHDNIFLSVFALLAVYYL